MNKLAPFTYRQLEYLHRAQNSWLNVAEGGKRGGKNVLQTLAFCIALETHPNRLHLIAGVSITTAKLNIIDCDGYGLMNYFEGRCREGKYKERSCLYINTATGEKIVLVSGGGKKGDERLIKGNTYGMAYVTEANECAIEFLREVFDRTLSSDDRKIFHDLNPKAKGHWYYTDILQTHEDNQKRDCDYGYNYGHFTIADNLSVSDKKLKVVLSTYDKRDVWYKRDILGLRIQAEGLVYSMFNELLHVIPASKMPHNKKQKVAPYEKYYISVDYGTMNPCVFLLWGLRGGVYYLIDEYYYNGRKDTPRTDEEHYKALEALAGKLKITKIIIDPSAASFITLIQRKKKFSVVGADNVVIDGIRDCGTALQLGLIKISSDCKDTIKEYGLYVWDDTKTEDVPIKENDHAMDAMRYFVRTLKMVPKMTKAS